MKRCIEPVERGARWVDYSFESFRQVVRDFIIETRMTQFKENLKTIKGGTDVADQAG